MTSINVGPFAFPIGPLLLVGAVFISTLTAWWAGRSRTDVEPLLWRVLLTSVVGARAAFVFRHFDLYKNAPWTIFDIRDGGFSSLIGVLVAAAMTFMIVWRRKNVWKPFLLSASAGMLFWAAGTAATSSLFEQPAKIPNLALTQLDGSLVQLQSLVGKPVVINLWATWCPPCRREMPVLHDAQLRHQDVHFVFANQGESAAAIRRYLDVQQLDLRNVVLDPRLELGNWTDSRALPTTLFYDENGNLVDRRAGELSAATLAQRIEAVRMSRKR